MLKSIRTTPRRFDSLNYYSDLWTRSFSPLLIEEIWKYQPIRTKRNDALFSLSLVSFFFPLLLSFFLAHSNSPKLPTKNGKLNRNPGHFPHVSSNYPPLQSVAVRTIIAGWIIAESNNKRSWGPQFPTGPFFVSFNMCDGNYELFASLPFSLPVFRAWFENDGDPSLGSKFVEIFHFFREKGEKIVVEFCALINYICASNTIIKLKTRSNNHEGGRNTGCESWFEVRGEYI